jgi:hypothetical protein
LSSEPGANIDASEQAGAASVTANLISCREEYEQLEIQHKYQVQIHNDAAYQLAQRIFAEADRLQEKDAWDEFVQTKRWEARKPPKKGDQCDAVRHVVRFMLPPKASRQTVSHWTIPLKALKEEGVPQMEIAKALRERGGFEGIRNQARATPQQPEDNPNRVKLFKKPPSVLPRSLREAVIVTTEDGKTRIEDSKCRRLLVLVLPPHLELNLQPGELHLSAFFPEEDDSTLDVTGLNTEVPVDLIRLRTRRAD